MIVKVDHRICILLSKENMMMKYLLIYGLFFSINVSGLDLIAEPDHDAPYGLTWKEYWSIKAEGRRSEQLSSEERWEILTTAKGREMAIQMARQFRMDRKPHVKPIDEEQRDAFCNARETEITPSVLWQAYPAITQRKIALTYLGETMQLEGEWMPKQYPEVWMTITGFIYCSEFYQGEYLQRPLS